jgi:hypothetical protein
MVLIKYTNHHWQCLNRFDLKQLKLCYLVLIAVTEI